MFTGLIEETGTVKGVTRSGSGLELEVSAVRVLEGTGTGDSICVNGACQTVTGVTEKGFSVFVSDVTASVTTLGGLAPGTRVNLERAMTPDKRFGGHIVQGHVDGTGTLTKLEKDSRGLGVEVALDAAMTRYIVPKGSVAVDGISLTVVSETERGFSLYLIPETLVSTTVQIWKQGDRVNIEVDILAKYVESMLNARDGKRGDDERLKRKLMEEGYY